MRRTALWELRAALMFTGWKIWTKLGGGVGGDPRSRTPGGSAAQWGVGGDLSCGELLGEDHASAASSQGSSESSESGVALRDLVPVLEFSRSLSRNTSLMSGLRCRRRPRWRTVWLRERTRRRTASAWWRGSSLRAGSRAQSGSSRPARDRKSVV